MIAGTRYRAVLALALLSLAFCRRNEAEVAQRVDSLPQDRLPPAGSADSGSIGGHNPAALEGAARAVVAFLRGEVGFDRIRLADTVTLYVAPEGGGTRMPIAREMLRDRSNWRVRGLTGHTLIPPKNSTKLTTRVGRHLNCMEYPLSSRSPELARLPHVGTKLEPPDASSCLQSWNLTLVFDPNERPPTLVAAVYDQWEW